MKRVLFSLAFCLFAILSQAQNGLENIIVETYYISNTADSAGSQGVLPVGSVTYRIYIDMFPGYKFQMAYGNSSHSLKFTTTTSFFNNTAFGKTTPIYSKSNAAKNTVMLDSWLSVGGACSGNLGIMKSEDNGVNNVVNANGILHNTDAAMGIPLTTQDGLIAGTVPSVSFIGITNETDVFNDGTANGNSFILTNAAWSSLSGTTGPTTNNRVLIAQITTDGAFHYELNIQIGTPDGGIEVYVANNPQNPNINGVNEISIPSLTGTLNGPPTAFPVIGSGSYCQGSGGLAVGLSNSEVGVTYTITPGSATLSGTGSAISFGNKLAGTYTISGTNTKGTTSMTGSAVIVENVPTVPTFTTLGPYNVGDLSATLPATSNNGINGTWNPTIISTASAGLTTYTFTPTTGQCASSTTMNVTVNGGSKTLSIKLFLEGLYAGSGAMNQAMMGVASPKYGSNISDLVTVELHSATSPFSIITTFNSVNLNTNGTVVINNISASLSASYYLVIKHRNSIETWSSSAINFAASNINYDFSTASTKAFGSNLKSVAGGYYAIFAGDANQDAIVDGSDMAAVDNASTVLLHGYNPEDVNGDGIVDGSDMAIIDNNATAIIQTVKPN